MPTLAVEPLAIGFTAQEVTLHPIRLYVDGISVGFTANSVDATTNYTGDLDEVGEVSLMRLDAWRRMVDDEGKPVPFLISDWQKSMEAIENAFLSQGQAIAAIQAALEQSQQAQAAASAANTTAQAAVDANALQNSFVDPPNVLAAEVSGSGAMITIAAHARVYADASRVSVNSGLVSGLAQGTTYRVYYDDAARAGGPVTYVATTDTNEAAQIDARHAVGTITTPDASDPPTTGNPVRPPGYSGPIPDGTQIP